MYFTTIANLMFGYVSQVRKELLCYTSVHVSKWELVEWAITIIIVNMISLAKILGELKGEHDWKDIKFLVQFAQRLAYW